MAASGSTRRVALVTGAARRIGVVIARRLHAAGYDVAVHARRSRAELDVLVAELERMRASSTLALEADLMDVAALPKLVRATVDRFGRLDALVNNAAAFFPTPPGAATSAEWDQLFGTNARAPFFLSEAAAPHLAAANGAI